MTSPSRLALLLALAVGASRLARAQETDPDLEEALRHAGDAARQMGLEGPDVRKRMEEVAREEAQEKASAQAVVDSPEPAKLPAFTPEIPRFAPSGPLARELVDGQPMAVQRGTSPLTPTELADAWAAAVSGQEINHVRNDLDVNGTITTLVFLTSRTMPPQEVRLESERPPGEKTTRVSVLSPLPVPEASGAD